MFVLYHNGNYTKLLIINILHNMKSIMYHSLYGISFNFIFYFLGLNHQTIEKIFLKANGDKKYWTN